MIAQTKKRTSLLKKLLVIGVIIILAAAAVYWYYATETFADTTKKKPAYTVNALDFIKEFRLNDSLANKKYTDKIITVNGTVSEIETADTTVNIKFVDTTTGSYAIFAFQEQHLGEAKTVKVGDKVSIKGSCSGGIYSEILGTEFISFKRCALNKH
jgi:type II secretory pathway pseudopilin PulG